LYPIVSQYSLTLRFALYVDTRVFSWLIASLRLSIDIIQGNRVNFLAWMKRIRSKSICLWFVIHIFNYFSISTQRAFIINKKKKCFLIFFIGYVYALSYKVCCNWQNVTHEDCINVYVPLGIVTADSVYVPRLSSFSFNVDILARTQKDRYRSSLLVYT